MEDQECRLSSKTKPDALAANNHNNNSNDDNHAKPQEGRIRMARNLGLFNGVAMMLSVVIGSGIFVSPRGVLEDAGSVGASLVIWSVCGLLCLLGALCLSELATSISSSGGEYTYIRLAYGPLPAFLYLWVTFTIILPCSNAISALTFSKYVLQPLYLPGATTCAWLVSWLRDAPEVREASSTFEQPPDQATQLLALALLLMLTYVNCASVKLSIRIQNSLTFAKVLALVLVISLGLRGLLTNWQPGGQHNGHNFDSWSSVWANTQSSVPRLAQALYAAFYTYAGW